MIECRFFDEGDKVIFYAKGHASYAPKGKDIVCAGISALLQAAEIGCANFAPDTKIEKGAGRISIVAQANQATKALLWTVRQSIERIAATYPGCIKVGESE